MGAFWTKEEVGRGADGELASYSQLPKEYSQPPKETRSCMVCTSTAMHNICGDGDVERYELQDSHQVLESEGRCFDSDTGQKSNRCPDLNGVWLCYDVGGDVDGFLRDLGINKQTRAEASKA